MSIPPLKGHEDLYNLHGQIEHKTDFISRFIPDKVKIHLVSHSIGSKISLKLLEDDATSKKIKQCYLLFPTIENMIQTSNGFWFEKVFDRFFFILKFLSYAFNFMPLTFRIIAIYIFCCIAGYPKFFIGTIVKITIPTVLEKIWFLAQDEMREVREIDEDIIKKNLHRLKFYYGTTDGWVPKKNYDNLIKSFPGVDAELCALKIDHGFIVSHGPTMARMLSEWIRRPVKVYL